jgi:hypothetical protein
MAYKEVNTWVDIQDGQIFDTGIVQDDGSNAQYEIKFDQAIRTR